MSAAAVADVSEGNVLLLQAFFSATDLLHFTVRIANLGVLLYIDDIKICKLCC